MYPLFFYYKIRSDVNTSLVKKIYYIIYCENIINKLNVQVTDQRIKKNPFHQNFTIIFNTKVNHYNIKYFFIRFIEH